MNFFKKIFVPANTQEITAYESWTVRWTAIKRHHSWDWKEEVEVFTNEDDAKTFKKTLEDARKLLKDYDFPIKINKN